METTILFFSNLFNQVDSDNYYNTLCSIALSRHKNIFHLRTKSILIRQLYFTVTLFCFMGQGLPTGLKLEFGFKNLILGAR